MLPQKVYEIMRWMVVLVIPALTTFYGVIGATFDIAYTQEVITIAVAFDACLGTIFQISKVSYDMKKGDE